MRYKGIKGKAWEAVKAYVAKRDGDRCFTCPRRGNSWSYDTGHFYPVAVVGSNNKLSWDERFIRRQCKFCNGMGQGMQAIFKENLIRELGAEQVEWFEKNYRKVNPIKNWQEVIAHYSSLQEKVE